MELPGSGRREPGRTIKLSRGGARDLKNSRYALWKNPEDLTTSQQAKLAWIAKAHPYLYRAWLLKEGLRLPFQLKGPDGKHTLDRWLTWAARCRIPEFVKLSKKVRKHLQAIHATSSTASATGGSSPLTPRSGSSQGWRSGSATPPPSSPWPCSHSAAWGPHYPEDDQYLTHGHGRRTSSETGQETYACWGVHKSPY